jgi:hypothetical protein
MGTRIEHGCGAKASAWRRPGALVWLVLGVSLASPPASAQVPDAGPPDFVRDLLPVIERNCLRCHNATTMKGEFVMDGVADVLRGGESGVTVVPGSAEESALVAMIERRVEPPMPPKHDLRPDEIAVFRAWIDAGAQPSLHAPPTVDDRITARSSLVAPATPLDALASLPDGFVVGGYKRVALMPAHEAWPRRVRALDGPDDLVRAVAASADGRHVAAGSGIPGATGDVHVWNTLTGEREHQLTGHRDVVHGVAFNADATLLAAASYDRTVRIWNLEQGRPYRVLREHTDAVFDVAFSRDGRWLASASADRGVKVWSVTDGTRLYTLSDNTDAVHAVAFHPTTGELWAVGADRHLRAWRVTEQGATLRLAVLAHAGPILRLACSPDGRHVATTSADRSVKIWDAATGTLEHTFDAQPDWAHGLAWSRDGATLLVGRRDGSLTSYAIASGRARETAAPFASQTASTGDTPRP